MKIATLRQKSSVELQKLLLQSKKKIQEMRFQVAAGKIKNVRGIRQARQLIARIKTVNKEKKEQ
tara:strand:- start:1389 stop:1580 length:192 start_codon:yes stop_codon:yes gene_type:complete